MVIAVAVAAVLALGGSLAERLFSDAGINPTSTDGRSTTTPTTAGPAALTAPLAAFLGITTLSPVPAPAIALVDETGAPVSLRAEHGKVVVVTFFNADCSDACPVLAGDIARADADLGANRSRVEFLTVNTDPSFTATTPPPAAVTRTGLGALGNWHFLTGSLAALDSVWRSYGVTINVSAAQGIVAHNNVMYFIDPSGTLRIRATPVADETTTGSFSLPASSIRRSGAGMAAFSAGLLSGHS